MASKYRIVLKPTVNSINPQLGIYNLNEATQQPYIDNSGNIEMSGNFLKVKNIEAGQTSFSINSQLGVINVYSNSVDENVYCINMKHDRNHTGGDNRKYCSFLAHDTDNITGSITGNSGQVSFNTTSDFRLKNIEASGNIINYSTTDTSTTNPGSITYSTWLDSVNSLNPCIFSFKPVIDSTNGATTDRYFNYTLNDSSHSVLYQGFIAQEVQRIYPPAVTEPMNTNSYYQMDATKLIPMMVGAIKELSAQVATLTNVVADLSGIVHNTK